MIDEKYIKVGQVFKGQVNGKLMRIIDIYTPKVYTGNGFQLGRDKYVRLQNLNPQGNEYKIIETNLKHFKHLLLDAITL